MNGRSSAGMFLGIKRGFGIRKIGGMWGGGIGVTAVMIIVETTVGRGVR
jgi:hypothetical protein